MVHYAERKYLGFEPEPQANALIAAPCLLSVCLLDILYVKKNIPFLSFTLSFFPSPFLRGGPLIGNLVVVDKAPWAIYSP